MDAAARDFDVVVVGGGMAGLAAALAAAEAGAGVALAEAAEALGGNARLAAGMFVGSSDPAGLAAYVPDGDPGLQRAFCADYEPALAWLAGLGLPLGPLVARRDFRKVRAMGLGRPGAREPFLASLAAAAQARGVAIRTGSPVRGLAVAPGGWSLELGGVAAGRLSARAVVLATGGFAASPELLARHMGPAAAALRCRSLPGAAGDGLRLAQALGAATGGDMQAFYGHSMADCPLAPEDWQPLTPYFSRYGVLVNRDGRRFVDESASLLEELNPQVGFRQPGGTYWLLFTDAVRQEEAAASIAEGILPQPDWLARARACGAPIRAAPSLAALAAGLAEEGVAASAFLAEIERYNAACRAGTAAALAPAKARNAIALDAPPIFAMRCVAGITATCGGIAVDERLRVLDRNGRPLAGLHAAGVDAGGVYGRTYGGFLAWALVSGRRAGSAAALPAA